MIWPIPPKETLIGIVIAAAVVFLLFALSQPSRGGMEAKAPELARIKMT